MARPGCRLSALSTGPGALAGDSMGATRVPPCCDEENRGVVRFDVCWMESGAVVYGQELLCGGNILPAASPGPGAQRSRDHRPESGWRLPVVVVNEEFVQRFFPDGDVLGRRIRLGGLSSEQPWRTSSRLARVDPPHPAGDGDSATGNTSGSIHLLPMGAAERRKKDERSEREYGTMDVTPDASSRGKKCRPERTDEPHVRRHASRYFADSYPSRNWAVRSSAESSSNSPCSESKK